MKINIDPVITSAHRLGKIAKLLQETHSTEYFPLFRKEVNILLRRTFKLWLGLKLGSSPWTSWMLKNWRGNKRGGNL